MLAKIKQFEAKLETLEGALILPQEVKGLNVSFDQLEPMPKMTRAKATYWSQLFQKKYPGNSMRITCINGQFWWLFTNKSTGKSVKEAIKFIGEDLKRPFIIINTGGHGDKNGGNPHTNRKFENKQFAVDDRRCVSVANVKAFVNEVNEK